MNERDKLYADGSFGSATTNLIQAVSGWGNFSGPSSFMLRLLVSGSATAVAFGMTASTIAATFYGTASIPWIVGSCTGFVLGSLGVYRDSLSKAFLAVDLYPRLLQLHLDSNFPMRGFRHWDREKMRSVEFSRSWTLRSMLVVSWMTAQPALTAVHEAKEAAMIAEASQSSELVRESDGVVAAYGKVGGGAIPATGHWF